MACMDVYIHGLFKRASASLLLTASDSSILFCTPLSCLVRQQENQVKLLKMMWSEDDGEKLSAQVQRLGRLVSEIRQACGLPDESKIEGKNGITNEGVRLPTNRYVIFCLVLCVCRSLLQRTRHYMHAAGTYQLAHERPKSPGRRCERCSNFINYTRK